MYSSPCTRAFVGPNWTCPGCSYRTITGKLRPKPRGHPDHVDNETCRYTIVPERSGTSTRRTAHPREPSVPAEEDVDANASVGDLPDYPPDVPHPGASSSSSSSSSAAPSHPIPDPAAPWRRGPDLIPRYDEEPPRQDANPSDWTRFNIDKSLRMLRIGNATQQL